MTATVFSSRFRPMLGSLLAHVVFVEGPGGTSLTDQERARYLGFVQKGMHHLEGLHKAWRDRQQPQIPASCSFTVTSESVTIAVDPASLPKVANPDKPTAQDFEEIDGDWIDEALDVRGFSSSVIPRREDRIAALAADATLEKLFAGNSPDDTFVMFVTKYPCHWMGYARPDVGFCTLCPPMLDVGGWKDRYDLVAAHETGHIFGAPDEYVGKNVICNPTTTAGPFVTPNRNCELNNPAAVTCLMRRSDLELCDQTPLHWGWFDGDRDGTVDLIAPPTIDRFAVVDPVLQLTVAGGRAAQPGWTVTISGRNVGDARVVTFGGVPSPQINRQAIDEIAVTVPEVSGIVNVAIVTRAGPTNATFEQSWFLVAEPIPLRGSGPVIFGLVPFSGSAGTAVNIFGGSLFGPTKITFGGVPADLSTLPQLDDQDPTQVTITVPAGPIGPVPVIVTTAQGSSIPSVFSTFGYT